MKSSGADLRVCISWFIRAFGTSSREDVIIEGITEESIFVQSGWGLDVLLWWMKEDTFERAFTRMVHDPVVCTSHFSVRRAP